MLKLLIIVITAMIPSIANATCGMASWYGSELHGRRTASGARFNKNALTAAHRSLPFGTRLLVTYKKKSIIVKVNDRGPFVRKRVLDLSEKAAYIIGMKGRGTAPICFKVIK